MSLPVRRPEFIAVTATQQRARRRQQRHPEPLYLDEAMYRIWQGHTTINALDQGNPSRYPAMTSRWGAALAAARAGTPLEGE